MNLDLEHRIAVRQLVMDAAVLVASVENVSLDLSWCLGKDLE
jgi:hypothetical protein